MGQVLARVKGHLREEERVDRLDAGGADQQGVAIGRGLGHRVGRHIAVGAGAVLNDDGLAQRLRQRLAHDARHHIGHAAGREGNDQLDGFGGPGGLGMGRECQAGCYQ
jgi:hypothetical protein